MAVKKRHWEDPTKYRLVRLTVAVSEVMETFIREKITIQLEM